MIGGVTRIVPFGELPLEPPLVPTVAGGVNENRGLTGAEPSPLGGGSGADMSRICH